MKRIFLFGVLLLFASAIFYSCKKELSCEGCKPANPLPPNPLPANQPPVARAGTDTLLTLPTESILLDGSASSDPDGKITEWLWTKIAGPASFTIADAAHAKTIVSKMVSGIYLYELKVTDDKGAFAKDTVQVTVDASQQPTVPNHPPVANAGVDQRFSLPVNTIVLDGSGSTDPDNNISAYTWTKISGPSLFNILDPGNKRTQVTNLVKGTYQFELKVSDAGGLIDRDTMQVIVLQEQPTCTGCKIVFVSDRDGNPEIYSCNADGSGLQRLTNNPANDDHPSWSPNGKMIAFVSDRSGSWEVYTMNADGSDINQKTFSASYSQNPSWSPDGTKIVYSSLSDGSSNLWVVPATNGAPFLLFKAPGWDAHPSWSPDGAKITFVSDWLAYDLRFDIYTINADGTDFTSTIANDIPIQQDYLFPRFSPDGSKLAFAISQRIGIDQYNTEIGVANSDGSGFTSVKAGAASWTRTAWATDGRKILYTTLSGSRKDLAWVSADGSSFGTIITNAWNGDWQH